MRLEMLAQHVASNSFFVVLTGLVQKPPWKRENMTNEQWRWAEETYQSNVAAASGWCELATWDDEGPLLLDSIPGLNVQPPPGEKWLFVVSSILCGVSGDLQGIWRITGMQQYSCPWCVQKDFTDWAPVERRNDAAYLARVNAAFSTIISAPPNSPDWRPIPLRFAR